MLLWVIFFTETFRVKKIICYIASTLSLFQLIWLDKNYVFRRWYVSGSCQNPTTRYWVWSLILIRLTDILNLFNMGRKLGSRQVWQANRVTSLGHQIPRQVWPVNRPTSPWRLVLFPVYLGVCAILLFLFNYCWPQWQFFLVACAMLFCLEKKGELFLA
jgi:hypothetical protein